MSVWAVDKGVFTICFSLQIVNSLCPTFLKYTYSELRLEDKAVLREEDEICSNCIFIGKINVEWKNKGLLHGY